MTIDSAVARYRTCARERDYQVLQMCIYLDSHQITYVKPVELGRSSVKGTAQLRASQYPREQSLIIEELNIYIGGRKDYERAAKQFEDLAC